MTDRIPPREPGDDDAVRPPYYGVPPAPRDASDAAGPPLYGTPPPYGTPPVGGATPSPYGTSAGNGMPPPPSFGGFSGSMANPAARYGAPPPSYLAWAIAATLLCCLPAGIVSIVYAAQVNSKYLAGDYAGALAASRLAKGWAIASTAVGALVVVFYVVVALSG